MTLNLVKGVCETTQYKAWYFPGGEIHLKLKIKIKNNINIITRINSSDDIIFLFLIVDTLKKENPLIIINLFLPYMPYQQADRNFGENECFSLKTITNLINTFNFNSVKIFDPHSDVTPGLINNCIIIDNSSFISNVLKILNQHNINEKNLVIVSPDASAYKKIFKLCEKIGFNGDIITCSKSRNHETGELTIQVPKFDENKSVLIIDDIALGSRTFLNIRNELKNKDVYLAVSHGVFNENIDKLGEAFNTVYTTNSRREESVGENIKVIKIF